MIRIVSLMLLAGVLSSCQKKIEPAAATLHGEVAGRPNTLRYPIGAGYRSFTGDFIAQPCVRAGNQGIRNVAVPIGSLRAGFSDSKKIIEDRFSLDASAKANLGLITVEGSAGVAMVFAESDLKTASYMTFTHKAGNAILLDPILSPVGQGMLNRSAADLYRECGDEYVYQVELGTRLHIGVEYTFKNKEVKSHVKAKLKVGGPFGFAGVEVGQEADGPRTEYTLGTIRLVALQEGGDQEAFKKIEFGIPTSCVLKVAAKKLVTEEFSACVNYFQNVLLPYARNDFPKQIPHLDSLQGDPTKVPGLDVLRYYTRRYDQSGWPELQSKPLISAATETYVAKRVRPHADRLFAVEQLRRSFDNLIGTDAGDIADKSLDFDTWRRFRIELDRFLNAQTLSFKRCQENIRNSVLNQANPDFAICDSALNGFDESLAQIRNDPDLGASFKQYLNL